MVKISLVQDDPNLKKSIRTHCRFHFFISVSALLAVVYPGTCVHTVYVGLILENNPRRIIHIINVVVVFLHDGRKHHILYITRNKYTSRKKNLQSKIVNERK
jgi:hypothetical protein